MVSPTGPIIRDPRPARSAEPRPGPEPSRRQASRCPRAGPRAAGARGASSVFDNGVGGRVGARVRTPGRTIPRACRPVSRGGDARVRPLKRAKRCLTERLDCSETSSHVTGALTRAAIVIEPRRGLSCFASRQKGSRERRGLEHVPQPAGGSVNQLAETGPAGMATTFTAMPNPTMGLEGTRYVGAHVQGLARAQREANGWKPHDLHIRAGRRTVRVAERRGGDAPIHLQAFEQR